MSDKQKITNVWKVDWSSVPKGTRIVFSRLYTPRGSEHRWPPRADGLYEVIFLRLKKVTDGSHEFYHPIFASVDDPKKIHSHGGYEFAFASDPEAVQELKEFAIRKAAEEAAQQSQYEARRLEQSRQREAERQRLRQEREQELRAKAAQIDVPYEELLDLMKLWDRLRRVCYRPNSCACCGRALTDPVSIVRGIGPECITWFPSLKKALQAKVLDIGKLRYNAKALSERLTRAGLDDMAEILRDAESGAA